MEMGPKEVDPARVPPFMSENPNLATTYKVACIQCRRPARLPLSKFCSDECGITCVMRRVDDLSATLSEPREATSRTFMEQLEACSAVRFAKRREGLVSVDQPSDVVSTVISASEGKRLEEARLLERLRGSLEELKCARVKKMRTIAAVDARLVLLDLALQRNEIEGKARCGFDSRLGMDDDLWEEWVESDDGRRAFEGYGIGQPSGMTADEASEMEILESCICQGPGKKCDRHSGWQKLKKADFELEKEVTVSLPGMEGCLSPHMLTDFPA